MRVHVVLSTLLFALGTPRAAAQQGDGAAQGDEYTDLGTEPEEIVVYGDRFARWDGTRWLASTQIGFPQPYVIQMRFNKEVRYTALEMQAVLACEKRWRRGNKAFEVDCRVEDFALRGVPFLRGNENAQDALDEMDTAITGAYLQLQVTDDGRVTNIDLENTGLTERRRERDIQERHRLLLSRLMAGFHMRLPPASTLREGQWVEYDATVFQIPGASAGNSGSFLVHQLDKYKGQLVVQSVGEATMAMPPIPVAGGDGRSASTDDYVDFYKVKYDGVSLYDKVSGIMTERVWGIRGRPTASSAIADGWGGSLYFQLGRLRMLGEDEKPDLGATTRANAPGVHDTRYPDWKMFE